MSENTDDLKELVRLVKNQNRLLENYFELGLKKDTFDVERTITTAQPIEPINNINAYQFEDIREFHEGKNGKVVNIINEGPGLLYVIYRHTTSDTNYTHESTIKEGDAKPFYDVAKIGVRSPTALLRYRITEHEVFSYAGQIFSGDIISDVIDDSGTKIYQDNYESATPKYESQIIGLGTIGLSTDTAYQGDFSLKFITGAAAGDNNIIVYYHTFFHDNKIGFQIRFASSAGTYNVSLAVSHFQGDGNAYRAEILATNSGGFFYDDQNGNAVSLSSTINITNKIIAWNVMKLVIDVSTNKYVSANLNGQKFDLSTINLQTLVSPATRHIEVYIGLAGPNAGAVTTAYFDNYVLTHDER